MSFTEFSFNMSQQKNLLKLVLDKKNHKLLSPKKSYSVSFSCILSSHITVRILPLFVKNFQLPKLNTFVVYQV